MKYKIYSILVASVLFFSCEKGGNDNVIANIEKLGVKITEDDVDYQISLRAFKEQAKYKTIQGRHQLFHDLARYNIFNAEADVEGLKNNKGFNLEHDGGIKYRSGLYYQRKLRENLFYDQKVLENYYNANISEYKQTDSTYLPYAQVKESVLKKYVEENENLKAFYEKDKDRFKVNGKVSVKHIFSPTNNLEPALAELKNGAKFEDVVKKYSKDETTVNSGGVLGSYFDGQLVFGIKDSTKAIFKTLFAMQENSYSNIVKSEKGYHIFWLTTKREAVVRSYDEVKSVLAIDYIKNVRDSINSKVLSFDANKIAKIKFSAEKLDTARIKKFYLANKEKFVENELKVSQLSSEKSKLVNQWYLALRNGAKIEELAKDPENKKIISEELILPVNYKYPEVRRDAKALKKVGDISEVFRTDWGYHVIVLAEIGAEKLPEFDIKREEILCEYYRNYAENNKNEVIAKTEDMQFTFGDYYEIAKNKAKSSKDFTRYFLPKAIDRFVAQEIENNALYSMAKKSGILETPDFKRNEKMWDVEFWAYIYENEFIGKYNGFNKDEILKYAKNKDFTITNEEVREIVSSKLVSDSTLYELYLDNIENFISKRTGKLMDFEVVKPQIGQIFISQILRNKKYDYYKSLYSKYDTKFIKKDYTPALLLTEEERKIEQTEMPVSTLDSLWKEADKFLEKNDVNPAMQIYMTLKETEKYYEDASVKLARLYEGKRQFSKALEIYDELLESKKVKKRDEVLFLKGFLFYDFLKRPDLGQPCLKELVKKYPESELADDASFLIKGDLPEFKN